VIAKYQASGQPRSRIAVAHPEHPRRIFVFNKAMTRVAASLIALAGTTACWADPVTLTFEGLKDQESVLNFYNGGTGSLGSTGTNYGISFAGNTLALIDSDVGGTGNFANEPTGDTVMFFQSGASTVLNVAGGFTESFSFFYSTRTFTGSVSLYDGVDGTGRLVGTIDLAALGTNCQGDPTGSFCNWEMASLSFAGTVRSIDFGGAANFTAFDNISFGDIGGTTPPPGGETPEPGSLLLAASALLALRTASRRRA
jgi:hypothetical protein